MRYYLINYLPRAAARPGLCLSWGLLLPDGHLPNLLPPPNPAFENLDIFCATGGTLLVVSMSSSSRISVSVLVIEDIELVYLDYIESLFFARGIVLFGLASSLRLGDTASTSTVFARSLWSYLGSTRADDILREFFVLELFEIGEMWGECWAVRHRKKLKTKCYEEYIEKFSMCKYCTYWI